MSQVLIPENINYKKILWLKEVGGPDRWAYMDVNERDIFDLHWPKTSPKYPAKAAIGDIILLKQHRKLTHLVIPYSNQVFERFIMPRWPMAREVICLRKLDIDSAPWLNQVFPFSLQGGAHGIGYSLQSFLNSHPGIITLDQLQKNIWRAFFSSLEPFPVKLQDESPEDEYTVEEFPEGKPIQSLHLRRERNAKLVKLKKDTVLKQKGILKCEVCQFSFLDKYGDIGQNFIEAHHIVPLSELKPESMNTIDDLALVCSNCHRMLHKIRPWITVDQLKERLIT
ncbi:MAG: hypothetical protein CVV03_03055 [Firmicutes bacterium HGW-Firmicutes-8]|nr:MAG: hypothetical protein CVV03_03055 [Firmicutes bacterium HGW-Firmicutes-8]